MTSAPEKVAVRSDCWCCGAGYAEADLVRLGQHPEVGICLGCARYVYRQRTQRLDRGRVSVPARVRAVIRAGRTAVIHRGWHHRPVLGWLLRRIDRHLP
jgi:hypothetical protein